jgi:hypothetical protein
VRFGAREPIETRVIRTGAVAPKAAVPVAVGRCLGCGYPVATLPAEATVCPECGRAIDQAVSNDPIGPVSAREAALAKQGSGLAAAGLVLVVVLPVVGAFVEAVGWWLLSAGPGRGRKSAKWLRWSVRVFVVLSVATQLVMWVGLADVYWLRFWVANTIADDVAAGTVVTLAVGVWTLRHAAGSWWATRLAGRAGDPGAAGLMTASGLGAVALAISGFLLIVIGVFVSHIALYPPLCLLLPLWVGALVAWAIGTAVGLTRLGRVGRVGEAVRTATAAGEASAPVSS